MINSNICIGIQSRLSSSRLPCKALLPVNNTTILGATIQRCLLTGIDTYLLTSNQKNDDLICHEAQKFPITGIIRGELNHVANRYLSLIRSTSYSHIIRVTADNPLTDSDAIVEMVKVIDRLKCSYFRYSDIQLPAGYHAEAFATEAFLAQDLNNPYVKEHVTPQMRESRSNPVAPYSKIYDQVLLGAMSCSVDTIDDYVKLRHLTSLFDDDKEFFSLPKLTDLIYLKLQEINSTSKIKW